MISTGKSDWEREVSDVKGTLAAYLEAISSSSSDGPTPTTNGTSTPGVFAQSASNKVSVQNGSHHTISDDSDQDTVLVFPDYKLVFDIDKSREGAEELWKNAVSPSVEAIVDAPDALSIPYSCVILLCECIFKDAGYQNILGSDAHAGSHKRRDNRCHIAAASLEQSKFHASRFTIKPTDARRFNPFASDPRLARRH